MGLILKALREVERVGQKGDRTNLCRSKFANCYRTIPSSVESPSELRWKKCLVGFVHGIHSLFRYRSRLDLLNDPLLESLEIRMSHDETK